VIWKLLTVAQQTWRKLNAPELLPLVASGVRFQDGLRVEEKLEEGAPRLQPKRIAA
jgi:hypothetical protein